MRTLVLAAMVCLLVAAQSAPVSAITLTSGGNTSYSIVIASDAIPSERYAADELALYLGKMTGAKFPIVTDGSGLKGSRIIVGQSDMSKSLLGNEFLTRLGGEELVIRTIGNDLILIGGRPRGTLYAVYHFLDNILGVRWWATDATYIPQKKKLSIKSVDIRLKPRFEYRDVFTTTAWNPDWAARNRLNGKVNDDQLARVGLRGPDEKHGGGMTYRDDFVNTFEKFIPESIYLKDHPEWFSLVNGKRVGGRYTGQLCLTNPEVLELMIEKVGEEIRNNPQVNIVSVSQNDFPFSCQCAACRKIDEEEGSQAGTLIRFVNAVAERIEKEYPDIVIDTLAYQHTQLPPRQVRPRSNVTVRLCDRKCSFAQPLTNPSIAANRKFVEDLVAWTKICKRVYVWDYVTNFNNYMQPHPDLRVLGPNLRLFASTGVQGVFEQGSYWTTGGEFQELRSWVLSRLLWNPQLDDVALIDEFLKGYYGDAAPYIKEYIDLLHNLIPDSENYQLTISGDSDPSPVVNMESMYKAESLFQKAQAAVADQPEVLNHVRRAHLPVQYMWLIYYSEWSAEAKAKHYAAPASMASIFEDFKVQIEWDDVTLFGFRDFRAQMELDDASQIGEQRPVYKLIELFAGRVTNPLSVTASHSFECWPEEAFDRDRGTGWTSGTLGPEWVQKDLGQVIHVESVNSCFGTPWYLGRVRYKIESSLDGKEWRTVVPEKTINTNESVDMLSPAVEAKFMRTTILQAWSPANQPIWVSLYEQTFSTKMQDK